LNFADIYHVKQRIVKLLSKSHPDYSIALHRLTSIFTEVKRDPKESKFKNVEDLKKSFLNWKTEFSVCQNTTPISFVITAGNILQGKSELSSKGGLYYQFVLLLNILLLL